MHDSNSTPSTNDHLLSRRAVAARFSVCTGTIKRWEKRGQLKPIRFNERLLRYRLSDIVRVEEQAEGGRR